jgi:hypothetical protein
VARDVPRTDILPLAISIRFPSAFRGQLRRSSNYLSPNSTGVRLANDDCRFILTHSLDCTSKIHEENVEWSSARATSDDYCSSIGSAFAVPSFTERSREATYLHGASPLSSMVALFKTRVDSTVANAVESFARPDDWRRIAGHGRRSSPFSEPASIRQRRTPSSHSLVRRMGDELRDTIDDSCPFQCWRQFGGRGCVTELSSTDDPDPSGPGRTNRLGVSASRRAER